MIPDVVQYLGDGLLHHPVKDRGNAQQAGSSVGFVDLLSEDPGAPGHVGSRQHALFDLLPVALHVALELAGFHAVNSVGSFIALDSPKRVRHVLPLQDRLHEANLTCRAFAQARRYESFN